MAKTLDKTISLARATKFIVDNRGKTAPTSSSGIPLIATNCVSNDDLYPTYKNIRYVSKETYTTWFRAHPQAGDILLTLKGSQNGAVCLVPDPVHFVIAQDMVALRADSAIIDPLFLFAALRSPKVQHQINNLDVSGVIPHFKKSDFDKLLLPYPDRSTQEHVGRVYFLLSSKIELNRRMNETLETMARAIFKDWFVDFGPTRAKMKGCAPYLAPEIWALFPDRLDNEDKPEGWELKPLDQIATFLNGLALQKYPATVDEYLPVIKIAELRAGSVEGSDKASTEIPAAYVVEDGDVLFSWSGSLLHRVWAGGRGALNQHLFKVTSTQFPKWFFFHWIGQHMEEFRSTAASKATTMGHIQRHHLAQAMTVVPSEPIMRTAHEIIEPMFERGLANDLESRTLAATRDLLVPKLMSGEIRAKEAEKEVQAVA